jgi:hypothetical protein
MYAALACDDRAIESSDNLHTSLRQDSERGKLFRIGIGSKSRTSVKNIVEETALLR